MATPLDADRAPETGIVFAASPDGARSTTTGGTRILSAALQPLNPAHAQAVLDEPHWRRNYPLHLRRLVEAGLVSGDAALASARAGLEAAWATLQWQRGPADAIALRDALAAEPAVRFETLTIGADSGVPPAP